MAEVERSVAAEVQPVRRLFRCAAVVVTGCSKSTFSTKAESVSTNALPEVETNEAEVTVMAETVIVKESVTSPLPSLAVRVTVTTPAAGGVEQLMETPLSPAVPSGHEAESESPVTEKQSCKVVTGLETETEKEVTTPSVTEFGRVLEIGSPVVADTMSEGAVTLRDAAHAMQDARSSALAPNFACAAMMCLCCAGRVRLVHVCWQGRQASNKMKRCSHNSWQ